MSSTYATTAELYDPATGQWTSLGAAPVLSSSTAVGLQSGHVLVVGGMGADRRGTSMVKLYTP